MVSLFLLLLFKWYYNLHKVTVQVTIKIKRVFISSYYSQKHELVLHKRTYSFVSVMCMFDFSDVFAHKSFARIFQENWLLYTSENEVKAKKKCILRVKYVSVTLFSEIFFMLQMRRYFNFWRSQSLGVHIGLLVLGYLKILGGVALKSMSDF